MKEYLSIPGWKQAPRGLPCLAFNKYDGSNVRCEWHKKRGFSKYGSRTVLMDKSHPDLGEAIPLFEKELAEPIERIFKNNKKLPSFDSAVVYCEFFGASSFAGQHLPGEPKELVVIDINLHKRGLILPRDFVRHFANDVRIPEVVYEGNFNQEFITAVQNGEHGTGEGVVVKGIKPGCKSDQHALWYSKVKTKAWLDELRARAANNFSLKRILEDNLREQE